MSDRIQGAYVQAWVWISTELLDPDLLDTSFSTMCTNSSIDARKQRAQLDKHILDVARDIYHRDGEIEIDDFSEIALQYDDGLVTADEQ